MLQKQFVGWNRLAENLWKLNFYSSCENNLLDEIDWKRTGESLTFTGAIKKQFLEWNRLGEDRRKLNFYGSYKNKLLDEKDSKRTGESLTFLQHFWSVLSMTNIAVGDVQQT